MSSAMQDAAIQPRLPRVVEVVGPAGAGKSTLCRALASANERVRLHSLPDAGRLADTPFFVWHGLRTIPTALRWDQRSGRQLTRREFAWLSILNGWSVLPPKDRGANPEVVVLDQGPVYLLTEISEFGPASSRTAAANQSLQAIYGRWASMLQAIIWLDAPDAVLAQRIQEREKGHVVKGRPESAVYAFLSRFRAAYARTLSLLAAYNTGFSLLLFDTAEQQPHEIADEILVEFGLAARSHSVL